MPGQPDGVAESGIAESPRCLAGARIQVEIAGNHQFRLADVLAPVSKDLVQLPEPKVVGAPTLQVEIVGHYLAPINGGFRYQGDSPAEPALKCGQVRHIPTGLPERG